MQEIADLMVRKRLEQVRVYGQLRRFEAAAKILDDVLAEEKGSRLLDEVLWKRAETAIKQEDWTTARDMLNRLLADYPESKRAGDATAKLAELDAPAEDPESEP